LSTTYSVTLGDTFDIISRKKYGTEKEALKIAKANPGVVEPLTVGISIIIPDLQEAPKNKTHDAESSNVDEVAILIDGKRFRFWDKVKITKSADKIGTIDLGAPFDADSKDFREIFKPFSFKSINATVGGETFFTGTMVAINPVLENTKKVIAVSGYSLPGVLNDCTSPASTLELLEFQGQGLREIAKTLLEPFGVSAEFKDDQGAIFDLVAIEPTKKILEFLIKLAKERNLIISSTPKGNLLFRKSAETGKPVANLIQGQSPLLSVTPLFNPQQYYSHITGIEPAITGLKGSKFTVKNERLKGSIRPLSFNVSDTNGGDTKEAVESKMGRMFGSMASYSISVSSWRDPQGNLWEPSTTLKLEAKDAMIYSSYEFEIRSVDFLEDRSTQTATLNLIIPNSFSGKIPEVLPWDE